VEAICHFPNLHLVVLSFWSVPNLVPIKRGREDGDLRGCTSIVDLNEICFLYSVVHFVFTG
jgi:hypothetical protein